jgi:hypothetical protein
MRAEMANACEEEKVAYETSCNGKVQLTQAHLDSAFGDDDTARRSDILDEARIGCCQKCGCLSATAEFRIEKNAAGQDIEYVFARCTESPSALALGHRVEPEPDVRRVHHLDPAPEVRPVMHVDRSLIEPSVEGVPEHAHAKVGRRRRVVQP